MLFEDRRLQGALGHATLQQDAGSLLVRCNAMLERLATLDTGMSKTQGVGMAIR